MKKSKHQLRLENRSIDAATGTDGIRVADKAVEDRGSQSRDNEGPAEDVGQELPACAVAEHLLESRANALNEDFPPGEQDQEPRHGRE